MINVRGLYHVLITSVSQVAKRRRNVFIKANVPCINDVAEARISAVRPLKIVDFGFVYTKNAIMAAQGMIAVETLVINCLLTAS